MAARSYASVGNVRIPDSVAAQDAEALARTELSPMLYGHSVRSHLYAALLADRDGLRYDEELLYVGCVLHDIALTPRFEHPVRPFELVSADVCAELTERHEWELRRRYELHRAVVLHMAPSVSDAEEPEVRLLEAGVACDVAGVRSTDIGLRAIDEILSRHPRHAFKVEFADLLRAEARRKPHCHAAKLIRAGLEQRIAEAPFP